MLNTLVSFSVRFRGVVIALACLLLAYGVQVARRAQLDVFPDFAPPQVVVQTESPGLSPEQVEALVTRPVENALNGAGGLESIRSESIQGLSIVTVVFKEGTDVLVARQMLSERLVETAARLPVGVKTPKMTPLTSATMDLLKIGLLSTNRTPMELRTLADWTLRPRLLAVPGVAKVSVFGGEVRQLQIQVRPDRLVAFNLTLADVTAAARAATGVRGAGFIETGNQRILLQTEGQSPDPAVLGEAVVAHTNGVSVRLKDVAFVVEAAEPKFGDALVQGRPGVLLTMSSQYGANTLAVTRGVEAALVELRPVLAAEGVELFDRLHRPANFIEHGLANMASSLRLGAVLVVVVLFLFLFNVRTAFISLTAIPLSLLAALVTLDRLGVTLNTLTLGGLAIALGEVVDDAIIDVENIFRRLRENAALPAPRPVRTVILEASLEVRSAVVYATFVVVLVFLPVIGLGGLQGKFFAPLGFAYILAILASLLVALTVTPALAAWLFARGAKGTHEPWLLRVLQAIYRRVLRVLLPQVWVLLTLVLLLLAGAAALVPRLGGEFLPEFREGHFVLQISTAPGTSLPEMRRLGERISAELLANPHIATVEEQIGRAEAGEDPWGPHRSEFHVELKPLPGEDEEGVQQEIRATLAKFPGITSEVLTFLGDRIGETISGETAAVVVSLYGDDLDLLDGKAREVAQLLNSLPGHADVLLKSPPGMPRLTVRLRPDRLRQFGFTPVEVMDALETAWQGTVVAQIYEAQQVHDVVVILEPAQRAEPETAGALLVQNASGTRLPLRELAEVDLTEGRAGISHDGARRRQTVTCNVEGRDVSSFVAEAKQRVAADLHFPAGVYAVFTGAAEQARAARSELLLHTAFAGVGIVLLLSVVLAHWRNLLLVLANLPFALVGGVVAVFFHERLLSLGALVGFVTLFGITTRNSIMLIAHYEHLVAHEGQPWNLETALRGAGERLGPILMTALVTALGLLPLALGGNEAGREIEGPMALVILGGLVSSTVLNLLVLPSLALRFGRFGLVEKDSASLAN
jgi:CzcA family heavy metal efflux pump